MKFSHAYQNGTVTNSFASEAFNLKPLQVADIVTNY